MECLWKVDQRFELSDVTVPLLHWTFFGPVQRPADTTHCRRPALVPVCGAFWPATPLDSPQRKRHPGLLVCEGRHTGPLCGELFKLHVPIPTNKDHRRIGAYLMALGQ
jgi:hypothetical protein